MLWVSLAAILSESSPIPISNPSTIDEEADPDLDYE